MKQLAQYQDGRLELQEVPVPVAPPGGILVRVAHSVISPGTEKMKVEQARMSLLEKARARPDQVRKVLETARTLGWKAALAKVRNRLESPTPLGYSAAGVVVAVDELNTRFHVGDRVACGGAECAHHAELIAVPDLLAARVPAGVELWQAAYTTLTSISMEAVRQSDARLGERVLVIGQGLVGLLATSLLKAAGARVMAVDYVSARLQKALAMGAECVVDPATSKVESAVREWTEGQGVDAVLLCVGGKGSEAADQAIACLRNRGVMVIVGMYDAELTWKTAYMKDIQVRYSRSYGPGRYDAQYEWGGRDYPIGHVRWTENRNFEACLQLMKSGALNLEPITTRRAAFADAVSVYDELMRDGNADVGVVLEYEQSSMGVSPVPNAEGIFPEIAITSETPLAPGTGETPSLHVIGAGNFVRTMLLPHLKGKIEFGTVVNGTGLSARHVREKFGFAVAETDVAALFEREVNRDTGCQPVNPERAGSPCHDEQCQSALLIGTRHHLHAPLVLRGLAADKHIFVEKPLCLTRAELSEIDTAIQTSKGSVMVGFNRRFAPAMVALRTLLKATPGAKSVAYHVFAGPLSPEHWYANVEESGGRVLGEACHMLDCACYLLDAKPVSVTAQTVGRAAFPDSVSVQVAFDEGSSFQLIYSAEGDFAFPKETLRIFGSGFVAECENFMRLSVFQNRKQSVKKFASKGHAEEMTAWLAFLQGKTAHPLPYKQSRQSMLLTFAVLESIREHRMVNMTA